jgi:iron complex transport system ATP-binding protein
VIAADSIVVRAGDKVLLDRVSFEAKAGELVAVVGANGAGKTTLVRVLSGARVPDSGRVVMRGRDLIDWPLRDRARVRAVVSQEHTLVFPFHALEVVLMGRTPHVARSESETERIAWEALEAVDMADRAYQRYDTLSGGERQRTHFARALAQIWDAPDERCLLLDEPTANLDIAHQHDTLALARDLSRRRCAVVAVLHDLHLAAEYADRVVLLARGRVVARGSPSRVFTEEHVRAAFGVDSTVVRHPRLDVPLVVAIGRASKERTETDEPLRSPRSLDRAQGT